MGKFKSGAILLFTMAIICIWFLAAAQPAFAKEENEGQTEDGWVYEDAGDGTLVITGYEGEEEDVVVPALIGAKAVSRIGDGALAGKQDLYTILVSEGITSIGEEAFADCPYLSSVVLPDTVTSMGKRTFRYCNWLQECTLPKRLTEFPYQCFWDCRKLKKITIPDNVTTIPNGAFYNNWNLAQVTVPDSVTIIEKNAFHACLALSEIRLSGNVAAIDQDAFSDCEMLEIIAPEGSYAETFARENGYIPVPAILESAHPYPHENQQWTYTHPTDAAALKVTFSPKTYFETGMDILTITDGENQSYLYSGKKLAGVTLVLAGNSFTMDLTVYETQDDNFGFKITEIEPMTAEEYQAYLEDLTAHPWLTRIVNGTVEITGYRGKQPDAVIPARIDGISVASIAYGAFADNLILRKVEIEEGIRTIGSNAFRRCENLEEIILSDSVTEIRNYAFAGCTKLEKIRFPKKMYILGEDAFEKCESLEELVLPEGLSAVEFALCNGCKRLRTVVLPDSIKEIGILAFQDCAALKELTLPEGLEVIGYMAFYRAGLSSLTIPSAVHTIGDRTFAGCENLTELMVDSDNPYFSARDSIIYSKSGDRLVCSAGGLSGVITVPDGVKEIGYGAFYYDKKITKVILPDGLVKLGDSVFMGCSSLEEVVFPETITVLPSFVFNACVSLKELRLPASLTTIEEDAFSGCDILKRIYIPDSVTNMETGIFDRSDNVVIYASSDSTAFRYAKEEGLKAIDVPLAKTGQYADGTPKELVTAGRVTGGRLLYALGDSEITEPEAAAYSEAVPAGVKAKTYYVWFKMTEDAKDDVDGKDLTDPECIPVKLLSAAKRVEKQIGALPAKIRAKDKASVDAVVTDWLRLTKTEKTEVSGKAVKKLAAAENVIYQGIAKARHTKIKSTKRSKDKKGAMGAAALVKWTKCSGASGYRIRYSTSKNFKKGVKIRTVSASSKKITLKKLKKGKKYYVQVIPFTKVKNRVTGVRKVIYGKKSRVKQI